MSTEKNNYGYSTGAGEGFNQRHGYLSIADVVVTVTVDQDNSLNKCGKTPIRKRQYSRHHKN
ncbi:hypothetical protein GCM10009413_01940 [Tatumella punctata]|uniref:hypothetical protein n=1 Tax=Tatumella punctata TaxID=399969 RepID=UPI0031DFB307